MTESRAAAMADDADMQPAPDKPQAGAPEALCMCADKYTHHIHS